MDRITMNGPLVMPDDAEAPATCPLCGENAGMLHLLKGVSVECVSPECYAEVPGANWDQTCKTAIAAWNRRAPAPDEQAVTPEFLKKSARAAINALRGLEQTAIMLERWAPEVFPEINTQGQKHFGRVIMESAAEAIRQAWHDAIAEVSAKLETPAHPPVADDA